MVGVYVVIENYDAEYTYVVGVYLQKEKAISYARNRLSKAKISIDVEEFNLDEIDDGKSIFSSYWSYYKHYKEPTAKWTLYENGKEVKRIYE